MDDFIKLIEERLKFSEDGVSWIEQEIQLLFTSIKQTNKMNEANLIFKNLGVIQFALAKAIFKNELEVTPFLREFVYDFDRIDDEDVRKYQYSKIKGTLH